MESKKKHTTAKIVWALFIVVMVILIGAFIQDKAAQKKTPLPTPKQQAVKQVSPFDFGNQSVMVNNQSLTFTNGTYESGAHTALLTDKGVDTSGTKGAAILTDSPTTTGTFYYLVGATMKNGAKIYSTPILLGNRVKIETVKVASAEAADNGMITVTYLDRPAGASIKVAPTKLKTAKYAFQENGELISVLR